MQLKDKVDRQRVNYIIQSYHLDKGETEGFAQRLIQLFNRFPTPMIELALVQILVDSWLVFPLPRGLSFLEKVSVKLNDWQKEGVNSTIDPEQFRHITGLDPQPIFWLLENQASRFSTTPD